MYVIKRRSKKLKKLEEEHQYLDKKVAQLTKDRLKDRSSEAKAVLQRLKKTKLGFTPIKSSLILLHS